MSMIRQHNGFSMMPALMLMGVFSAVSLGGIQTVENSLRLREHAKGKAAVESVLGTIRSILRTKEGCSEAMWGQTFEVNGSPKIFAPGTRGDCTGSWNCANDATATVVAEEGMVYGAFRIKELRVLDDANYPANSYTRRILRIVFERTNGGGAEIVEQFHMAYKQNSTGGKVGTCFEEESAPYHCMTTFGQSKMNYNSDGELQQCRPEVISIANNWDLRNEVTRNQLHLNELDDVGLFGQMAIRSRGNVQFDGAKSSAIFSRLSIGTRDPPAGANLMRVDGPLRIQDRCGTSGQGSQKQDRVLTTNTGGFARWDEVQTSDHTTESCNWIPVPANTPVECPDGEYVNAICETNAQGGCTGIGATTTFGPPGGMPAGGIECCRNTFEVSHAKNHFGQSWCTAHD